MKKKPNLALIVVYIIIIEGLAIYLNMVVHPKSQPGLTIFIVAMMALIFGVYMWYFYSKKIEIHRGETKTSSERLKYGIGFWIGGGVYSLINMIMNLNKAGQNKILIYNYLITGVAGLGLILNMIFLNRSKK